MKTGLSSKLFVLAGFGLCLNISPVLAGFQFTAPVETARPAMQAVPQLNGVLSPQMPNITIEGEGQQMPAAPNAPVSAQPMNAPSQSPISLTPMPQQGAPRSPAAMQAPQPITPKTGISSLAPTSQSSQPARSAPAPLSTPAQGGYEMAVGFGRDLPLVTALRQVVPADYAYVLGESAPVSTTVSWEGGRPWNIVLADMLSPLGLQASIQGKRVTIYNAAMASASSASMPRQVASTPASATAPAPVSASTTRPETSPQMNAQTVSASQNVTPIAPSVPAMSPSIDMQVHAPQTAPQFSAPPMRPAKSMVVPKVTRGTWMAERGDSLRNVLEDWASQAGADLFWSSDYDYPLAGEVNISGSFEEATETLLQGFEQARPKPIARLHPNLPHGPAVLVVETRQAID